MNEIIPKAIWEGELTIGGVTLRCCVLDNHERIFNAEDIEKLFRAMGSDDFNPTQDEYEKMALWTKGK